METDFYTDNDQPWSPAILSNIKVTIDHDLFEGAKDTLFQPSSVLDHKVTNVLVRKVETDPKLTIKLNRERKVRFKVL